MRARRAGLGEATVRKRADGSAAACNVVLLGPFRPRTRRGGRAAQASERLGSRPRDSRGRHEARREAAGPGRRPRPDRSGGRGRTPLMRQYLRRQARASRRAGVLPARRLLRNVLRRRGRGASKLLGLTLTSRNKQDPEPMPMCGMPWHQRDAYVARLLRLGHKVAICDQLEDPSAARGPGAARRDRSAHAGLGDGRSVARSAANNFLASLWPDSGRRSASCLADASTGEVQARRAGVERRRRGAVAPAHRRVAGAALRAIWSRRSRSGSSACCARWAARAASCQPRSAFDPASTPARPLGRAPSACSQSLPLARVRRPRRARIPGSRAGRRGAAARAASSAGARTTRCATTPPPRAISSCSSRSRAARVEHTLWHHLDLALTRAGLAPAARLARAAARASG